MKTHFNIICIVFILLISLTHCTMPEERNKTENELLTDRHTVINDTSQLKWICDSIVHFWSPTKEQLMAVESILEKAIKENHDHYWTHLSINSVKEYYRQYSFFIDQYNDKIVYINAFCGEPKYPCDWKNEFMDVLDGGDCYWSIQINLTKESYFDFIVNGVA
ncbi:MAG: hypothetical protein KQH79_05960 [Bacteroidetes bacterium]|nr:hypothetical protein [Bacteroidota bacterium]